MLSSHFPDFRAPAATCSRDPHTLGSVTFPRGPSGLGSTSALTWPQDYVRVGEGTPQAHRTLALLNPFPSLEECPLHVGQGRLSPGSQTFWIPFPSPSQAWGTKPGPGEAGAWRLCLEPWTERECLTWKEGRRGTSGCSLPTGGPGLC